MSLYKRGDTWWYEFVFSGERIRESTKQSNKRTAEQMEAARRTQLAKGEVGIKDKLVVPTLGAFAEKEFLPFVEQQKSGRPNTVTFYRSMVRNLEKSDLWRKPMDKIEAADLTSLIARRQSTSKVSTINRELATLRRMFKLAAEWGRVVTALPKVRLMAGENRRERVVTPAEEKLYLEAAGPLLSDLAVLMLECGLRPDEAHRLKRSQFRNVSVEIHTGKTGGARRSIPASPRVQAVLEQRSVDGESEWMFPAATKTGHIAGSSIKKQHAAALKTSGVTPFVIYTLRHTCLTRWAESGMDVFTLKRLAGHTSIATSERYVHMSDQHSRTAMQRVWDGSGYYQKSPQTSKPAVQ